MKPVLSNFAFDMPNLQFVSYQLRKWLDNEGMGLAQDIDQERQRDVMERNGALLSLKRNVARLLALGVTQEELFEVVREGAVQIVQES